MAAVKTCRGCFVAFVMTAFSLINKEQIVQVLDVILFSSTETEITSRQTEPHCDKEEIINITRA